ncbi:MAG TPA: CHRD domain-containing protein [Gemmatimonadales bacterium]|jgi:Cu/Zn superoxide dismutase
MHVRIAALGLAAALTARLAHPASAQSITYTAQMTGAQETPATTSTATGTATLTLIGSRLHYTVTVHNLSNTATAAHIHVGATGVGGPPVYSFTVHHIKDGTVAAGTIDLNMAASPGVSGDSLKTLLSNGHAYVNVHTATDPNGEIRGQLMKQ